MKNNGKNIIVVGDRILIRPDTGEKKSPSGLYLPPSVVEKQDVRGGVVVEVGPGIPLGSPDSTFDEPWKEKKSNVNYWGAKPKKEEQPKEDKELDTE